MKNVLLTLTLGMGCLTGNAQTQAVLDENNVSLQVYDNGYWFNDSINSVQAYEVPKGSGKHAIYAGSFWFGGVDVNGQMKLAAQQFAGNGDDYRAGASVRISPSLSEQAIAAAYFGQTVWTVSKAEVDYHIANYQSGGYVMPNDIANWPAHGDTSLGFAGMLGYIAPFVDVNNDGNYDPSSGDYPCIKGDRATYTIMNDYKIHMASGGEPILLEVHTMFYQFNSIPGLEDVTFVDIELVNMGTQTLYDTRAAFFLDADLGNYQDDYVGTDVQRKMVYTYNGDAVDETNGGALGYGSAPPAIGLMTLSHPLDYSISYSNGAVFPQSDPNNAQEFYQAMNGNYLDGSNQLDNLGDSTDYFYTGDPNLANSWSESNVMNSPGDRRMLASTDLGTFTPDFSVGAASRITLSYAIVYAQGTDNLNSVSELQVLADYVQSFYNIYETDCFDFTTVGIEEINKVLEFNLYPNPNTGNFTLQFENHETGTVRVHDHIGRIVYEAPVNGTEIILNTELSAGVYQVELSSENGLGTQKFIVQ